MSRKKVKPISKSGHVSAIMTKITRKKRVKYLLFFTVAVIIIIFFVTGPRGTYQLLKFSKQKSDLEQEINNLEVEKKELEEAKRKIETEPEQIEKVAREKYKMKKKDEKVYQIVEDK